MSKLCQLAVSAAIVFASAGFAIADEADELREQAKRIRREANELAELGRVEEAENLERKAIAMIEEAEHLDQTRGKRGAEIEKLVRLQADLSKQARELEERGDEKSLDRVRHQLRDVEHEIHIRREHHDHAHAAPHGEAAGRLDHMRAAVEHLKRAGMHEIAEQVAQRAHAVEREMHAQRHHHAADPAHRIMQQIEELRREVARLREEVSDLRESR